MKFLDITNTVFNNIDASQHMEFDHEKLFYCEDSVTGLKSIVAIHSSKEGPAIGGCRFHHYQTYEEGLMDVLRLSRGMTEKNKAANIPFGGGKAIIFGDRPKSTELLQAFALFLNYLEGAYYSAEDIGITLEDIQFIKKHSNFVFDNVDPGPFTAKGLFYSIEQAINTHLSENIQGKKIAIQGAGSVGKKLAEYLAGAGANVFISDIDKLKLEAINDNNITCIDDAFTLDCDLLAPCAVGGIFTKSSIKDLNCKIIAGGANNQLLNTSVADDLHERGILFIPDILINSGGVIGLTKDFLNRDDAKTEEALKEIAYRVREAIIFSKEKSISINETLKRKDL